VKLPNRESAYVPRSKLEDYLLSQTHPVGRWKAKVFRTAGFDETKVGMLEQGLISIARSEEVKNVVTSTHGTKYVIEGLLETPTGTAVRVRTIWIMDADGQRPRFVTAYPLRTGEEV
jgi:hypothetical protein